MKNPHNADHATTQAHRRKRGSALAAVLIICTCTALVAGSAMQTSTTERRLNHIAALNTEARNASEAVVDFGLAQLEFRFSSRNSFSTNELAPSKNPLILPDPFYTLFSGSNVVMPANPYNGSVAYGTYSTEIIGGSVPSAGWTFIDSTVPGNENDELADRRVNIRDIDVLGRATVTDSTGMQVISRCRETLQVRDAPIFSYAIFYNMDLEIAPGVSMEITGPVHTNGNLYVAPNPSTSTSSITAAPTGSATLKFDDTVTAVGTVLHSLPTGYSDTGGSSTDMVSGVGNIYFTNKATSVQKSMYQGSWVQSTTSNWYTVSNGYWKGGVQDKAYSVRNARSVAFSNYVRDDTSTSAVDDDLNYAYQIVMPLVPTSATTATTTSPAYSATIESQKYAYKAGLVIVVNTDSTNGITGFSLYSQAFNSDGTLIYSGTTAQRTLLTSVSSVTSALSDTVINAAFFGSTTATPTGTNTKYASESSSSNNVASAPYTNSGIFRVCNYYGSASASSSATVTSGMWDSRQAVGMDILEIDMNKLRVALNTADARQWHTGLSSASDATYCPKTWWNGIIYVQFDYDTADSVGNDNVRRAAPGYAVRLTDAQASGSGSSYVPGIPCPSWSTATGTTIATNEPVYTLGNYNSDGNSSTGSATTVDSSKEPAASIAADSITILSSTWMDYYSARAITKPSTITNSPSTRSTTTFTEVSAALISGIVPTNKAGNDLDSGGVHNYLRFLEFWNATVCYRGSIVCLYESEAASKPFRTYYTTSNYVYSPPTRNWGFNSLFTSGIYPPGTPLLRTFRSVNLKFLSQNQWDTVLSTLNP